MEIVIDSDKVFYLKVESKENRENCHKDGLSKFYSKIIFYCKLLNFIDLQWSRKTNLIMIMNGL